MFRCCVPLCAQQEDRVALLQQVRDLDSQVSALFRQGHYEEALPAAQQAVALCEQAVGPEDPLVATSLGNLAAVHEVLGRYADAEPLLDRALAIREKALGPEHPSVATTLVNRAWLLAAQDRLDAALADSQRALEIENRLGKRLFAVSAARQAAEFAGELTDTTDCVLSLCAERMADTPQTRRMGLEVILARKGWLLASQLAQVRATHQASDPQTAAAFAQLQSVREQLAKLAFSIPAPEQVDACKDRWGTLEAQQDDLEAELARRSAESAGLSARAKADLQAVAGAIPPDAALVECMAYQTCNFKAINSEPRWGEWKYVAYVLRPGADAPDCVPLGPADKIDQVIAALRQGKTLWDVLGAGLDAYDLIWKPLEAHLTGVERVILSPDGELALVPFAALPCSTPAGPQFLCEKYVLQLVNSGRDLIPVEAPATSGAVLLGAPDFEAPAALFADAPPAAPTSAPARPLRGLLRGVALAPLPQTRTEVLQIAQRLTAAGQSARVLLGAEATKQAVETVAAPRCLHLATHGFFLPDAAREAPGSRPAPGTITRGAYLPLRGQPALAVPAGPEQPTGGEAVLLNDPMYRSGLALAGAQRVFDGQPVPEGQDDGVLTAGEVAGLNLHGTRLVVLSACDTGRCPASTIPTGNPNCR